MLLVRDEVGFAGRYREVAIEVWREPGGVEQIKQRQALQRAVVDELKPRQIITLTVVHANAIRPLDKEIRELIDTGTKTLAPHVKATVVVVDADGLKAAIVRGIIASLTLFSGARYPSKVTATPDEAFDWIGPHLEAPGTAAELSATYHSLL